MESPAVSVVMAVRNGQRYVAQAIESILRQSFKEFEFIIVDDASTDDTPEILERFRRRDPRISVLSNERRLERSASRNKAIRRASAKYVSMIDADDLALPRRLEVQLAHVEDNPEVALLGTWAYEIDSTGRTIGMIRPSTDSAKIRQRMLRSNQFIHSSVLARKDAIKAVGLFDERLNTVEVEDYDLYFRIAQRYQCENVPAPLVVRRVDWDHERQVHRHRRARQMRVRLRAYRSHSVGPMAYVGLVPPMALWCLPARLVVALRRWRRSVRTVPPDDSLFALLTTIGAVPRADQES